MRVLRAKLYEVEQEKKRKEQASSGGEKLANEWGSQIRSYVLQPYQLVKDHRTNLAIGDVQRVLDGGIQPFIDARLRQRLQRGR